MDNRDFEMPCGCKRVTHRNNKGEIEYIDEAICAKHLRPMWDALPVLSRRFPVHTFTLDAQQEDTDHE